MPTAVRQIRRSRFSLRVRRLNVTQVTAELWSCPGRRARSMSSEPQVTSSTTTKNSTKRVPTRRQADLLPVYDAVGRWLHREPDFLQEREPEHHREELALMTRRPSG